MSRKTVTIEVTEREARYLLTGAQRWLGHVVEEYDGREAFRFMIDGAKSDVARWKEVVYSFD
jgi:hypothetical protein